MEKLIKIQKELKAPKKQFNISGKYNYRSCEDILEAVKPLLAREELVLTLTDTVEVIGNRHYVKATATIKDRNKNISVSAYAREPLSENGINDSQLTGTASSYARKYALNGLFLIDDTKDADTDEYKNTQRGGSYNNKKNNNQNVNKDKKRTLSLREHLRNQIVQLVSNNGHNMNEIVEKYNLTKDSTVKHLKYVLKEMSKHNEEIIKQESESPSNNEENKG